MNFKLSALLSLATYAVVATTISCGSGTGISLVAYDASQPSTVMTGIGNGISKAGSSMSAGLMMQSQGDGQMHAALTSASCSSHGDPTGLTTSDAGYPGTLTYCKIKIDDGGPDTVQGGFALVKSIACELEHANALNWNLGATSITFTPSLSCFTASQITNLGSSGMSIIVNATSPASFNTYFDYGAELTVSGFGTYKLAAKVSSAKIEFISYEYQSSTKTGASYGSLEFATGKLAYETRMERINCAESGSCGWSRHIRMQGVYTMSGNTPTDLRSLTFGYSNVQAPPGQGSYGGTLITADGNLTTGIKARLFLATNGAGGSPTTAGHLTTIGNWTETTNTKCYTSGTDAAGTCGAGVAGLTSSTAFLLLGTYTPSSTWHMTYHGPSYTTIDPNSDGQ